MKEYIFERLNESKEAVRDVKVIGELIRCKDCKWFNKDEDECRRSGLDADGYEFCIWAERKEE